MSMEQWWNDNWEGKTKKVGEIKIRNVVQKN
jgi:hypothetical protein